MTKKEALHILDELEFQTDEIEQTVFFLTGGLETLTRILELETSEDSCKRKRKRKLSSTLKRLKIP